MSHRRDFLIQYFLTLVLLKFRTGFPGPWLKTHPVFTSLDSIYEKKGVGNASDRYITTMVLRRARKYSGSWASAGSSVEVILILSPCTPTHRSRLRVCSVCLFALAGGRGIFASGLRIHYSSVWYQRWDEHCVWSWCLRHSHSER